MPAPSLHELQRGFADAVGGRSNAAAQWIDGAGLEPAARLRIYRRAAAATHSAALRDSYPAVLALVGEDFFDTLAHRYATQHPSRAGNLQHYGEALATVIESMPAANSLEYLADLARLEWLRQRAALVADAAPADNAALALASQVEPQALHLRLHPSLHAMRSPHALLTLWRWCITPTNAPPSTQGPVHVLLWRDGGDVVMADVTAATFACVQSLIAGVDVYGAFLQGQARDEAFDMAPCLVDLRGHGLITDVYTS